MNRKQTAKNTPYVALPTINTAKRNYRHGEAGSSEAMRTLRARKRNTESIYPVRQKRKPKNENALQQYKINAKQRENQNDRETGKREYAVDEGSHIDTFAVEYLHRGREAFRESPILVADALPDNRWKDKCFSAVLLVRLMSIGQGYVRKCACKERKQNADGHEKLRRRRWVYRGTASWSIRCFL